MSAPRSHCWIAGYTKRLKTGATSAPEEDCAPLEPGEWEAGQSAAARNVELFAQVSVGLPRDGMRTMVLR